METPSLTPDAEASVPVEASGSEASSSETVDASPVVEAVGETPTFEVKETPSSAYAFVDEFGWDGWDGKIDMFPEEARPFAQRIYDHRQTWVDQELERGSAETIRLKDIYEDLLQGQEDPRVKETLEALTKLQGEHDNLVESSGLTKKEYEEYQGAVAQAVNDEAKAIADTFKTTYPEIFSDKEKRNLLGELLDEDWDLGSVPKVMALGETARAVARKARREGVPDGYALQLADTVVSKPATPRPGAKITAGADGPAPAPHGAKSGAGDAQTIEEKRKYAVSKAFRVHKGGRN